MAKRRKQNLPKLLFVDANIWLDFYRGKSEAALSLLRHLELLRDKLIVTYQLEMEYKKHRQSAILEGMKVLGAPSLPTQLGVFSDAKELKTAKKSMKSAEDRIHKLKRRLHKILVSPTNHDEVYKTAQRLFHSPSPLVLTRDNPLRKRIRARAYRRFVMGYPPRKSSDTSMGDAINWEWMIDCATERGAELVIVTRDTDYGCDFEGQTLPNDHLAQEFSERVSRKRKIILCRRLSDALKHFEVAVTAEEEAEEVELIVSKPEPASNNESMLAQLIQLAQNTGSPDPGMAPSVFHQYVRRMMLLRKIKALEQAAPAAEKALDDPSPK